MVITKHEDVTKQGFCRIVLRKLHLRGSLLLVLFQFFLGWEGEGERGGGGRLLTFSAIRMGAYSNKYGNSFNNLACLPRARLFSLSPTTSKRLLRRLRKCAEISLENSYVGIGASMGKKFSSFQALVITPIVQIILYRIWGVSTQLSLSS